MKAKIKGIEVEGSPQEFKELLGVEKKHKKYKKHKKKKEGSGWVKGRKLSKAHKEAIGEGVRNAKLKKAKPKTLKKKTYHQKENILGTLKKRKVARWTPKQDAIIIKEASDGKRIVNIAKIVGRTVESTKLRIRVLRYQYMKNKK